MVAESFVSKTLLFQKHFLVFRYNYYNYYYCIIVLLLLPVVTAGYRCALANICYIKSIDHGSNLLHATM